MGCGVGFFLQSVQAYWLDLYCCWLWYPFGSEWVETVLDNDLSGRLVHGFQGCSAVLLLVLTIENILLNVRIKKKIKLVF